MIRFSLSCPATPWASRRLVKAALSILSESVVCRDSLHDMELALTEASANVVRHAYCGCEPGQLALTLNIQPMEFVEVEVSDWGCGFGNLPPRTDFVDPEAQSGRGLYIMAHLADKLDFRREHGKNTVYLRLHIGGDAWKTCD